MQQPFHIAIVGGSGAGKSWLARRLQAALGGESRVGLLSLDDFYRDLSGLEPAERERVNFDHPDAIDWDRVRQFVEAIRAGRSVKVPRYDFATHTRLPGEVSWVPQPILIWEGLWLLQPGWLRDLFSHSIFLDCPAEERLARRCARDLQERGRTRDAVERQFQEHVAPMHERFVDSQRQWATRCLTSPLTEEALANLVRQVRKAVEEYST